MIRLHNGHRRYHLGSHMPRRVMVRYGSLDATPAMVDMGDGTHVGSPGQIIQRIESGMRFIGAQWPDADFGPAQAHLFGIPGDDCTRGYVCTLQIHSDAANRTT